MALRKPPSTREREVAFRVARAKPPQSDPDGCCFAAIAELSRETCRDLEELLDLWSERSAMRQYAGEQDIQVAELAAVDDVRDIIERQRKLL